MKNRFLAGISLAMFAPAVAQTSTPNIVVILADDMGWTALSERMDKNNPDSRSDYYQTPNLNRILNKGMRFSSGYAAAHVSSPTRHSIQTGMTPARINHYMVGQNTSHINYATLFSIPKMIKAANPAYVCAHFGKWHLDCDPTVVGYDQTTGDGRNPDGDKGIEIKDPNGNPGKNAKDTWLYVNLGPDPKSIFSLTDISIKFIEEQKASGRPFYLQLSHYATHKELVSTPQSYARFNGLPRGEKHKLAQYAAMLWDMDVSIGKLLDRLEQLGLMENTYIFFTTDNGGVPFFPPNSPDKELKNGMGDNSPLRRGKWDLTEGGVRVPFFVSGPGIKPGSQCDYPVISYDLLPTFAQIVGYKKPMPDNLDGISFLPSLQGKKQDYNRPLYFHAPYITGPGLPHPQSAIRIGDYKVLKYLDNDQLLLFNLRKDLGELNDLSASDPKRTKEMGAKLDAYLKSVNAAKYSEMKDVKGAQKND